MITPKESEETKCQKILFPKVSVVMATHNNSGLLANAIESILCQSFGEWELIIVDDGSSDCTCKVVNEFCKRDGRVRYVQNKVNVGLAESLNRGCELAKGDLIARMDDDDHSHTTRLQRQVSFMEANPEIDVLGTAAILRAENGEILQQVIRPQSSKILAKEILYRNPFFHSSVMMRKCFFNRAGGYNQRFRRAQDYELWSRCVSWARYANLDSALITYTKRRSPTWVSILYGTCAVWLAASRNTTYCSRFWYSSRYAMLNIIYKFRCLFSFSAR